jgi:ribose transport system substrate-binding protein
MNSRRFFKMTYALGMSLLVACGGQKEQPAQPKAAGEKAAPRATKPHIALIMKAISNPFFKTMAEGATGAANKLSVRLTCLSVPKETDFEQQAQYVENMVAQNASAIVIAPADSKAIISALLEAQKKGIPIINIDNRIDTATAQAAGLKIVAFIGPDNAAGAEKSTDYLIQRIGGKGKVAMLEGIRGVSNAEARKQGFLRAVAKTNGAVTVEAMETAEWATDMGEKKMSGILARVPDLDGVFCANDNMAFGAIAAIESADKTGKVRVTAYDNLKAAQDAILEGKMDATVEQHPDLMGAMGVENALKAVRGEAIPPQIAVPTDLITAETLKKAAK